MERMESDITSRVIGLDTCLKKVYTKIRNVARYDVNVLITGETGTGKEVISELIHSLSPRNNGPFVRVNCASIPEPLFESELFGHVKGAFTGAVQAKCGLIEQANHGTLFLDEIGELPVHLQPKLLRVLNDNHMYKVGSTKEIKVDFRLISATNVNLETAIIEKKFRSDLYFRINSFPIRLPPLRSRTEGFKDLVNYLVVKVAQKLKRKPVPVDTKALKLLMRQSWPGNIRQLEQVLLRAMLEYPERRSIDVATLKDLISIVDYSDYQTAIQYLGTSVMEDETSLKVIQNDIISFIAKKYNYNVKETAQAMRLSMSKIYRSLKNCTETNNCRRSAG